MAINPDVIHPSSSDGQDAIEPPIDWSIWGAMFGVAIAIILLALFLVGILNTLFHPTMMVLGLIFLWKQATKRIST